MTLIPYTPDRLDALALRLFDLAASFREMANRSRQEGLEQLALHDKKPAEWLAKLEYWTEDAVRRFELTVIENRGAQRANQLGNAASRPIEVRD